MNPPAAFWPGGLRWLRRGPGRPPLAPAWDSREEHIGLAKALMHTTAALLHGDDDGGTVVRRYCEALVGASNHLPLAWCWFGPAGTELIQPQLCVGRAAPWAAGVTIARNWLTARGPAYQALGGRPARAYRLATMALWGPWRDAAVTYGMRSVLCLPLPSRRPGESGVFVVYADREDYFDARSIELFEPIGEMFGSILSKAQAVEQLRDAVVTDPLTGLGNRHVLPVLAQEVDRQPPDAPPFAVVAVDLDHFKDVNDTHGHGAGDRVLQSTAAALRAAVRHSDTVLRLGGEEFLVCLRGVAPAHGVELARAICERLRHTPHPLDDGRTLRVTASLGVASMRRGESLPDAIKRADEALYLAKRAGRDRVCVAAADA